MNDLNSTGYFKTKIPLKKAFQWIFLSILFISGSSVLGYQYYQYMRDNQKTDPAYTIVAIVQTSANPEGLRTLYLAELLNLSIDHPTNLYAFNSKEATQKLLQSPVIKDAKVRKIRPGTIHVDYTLRKPIAFIGDYQNTAIDAEGMLFPFKPFFTPKNLPEIILGEDEGLESKVDEVNPDAWGKLIRNDRVKLAFELLAMAEKCCDKYSSLQRVDVSKAFALSSGQKQIVLVFEDRIQGFIDGYPTTTIHPRILRLSTDNYHKQLANYLVLRNYLLEKNKNLALPKGIFFYRDKATLVDLRLSELAFIASES